MQRWTTQEIDFLEKNFKLMSLKDLAQKLNKSSSQISYKANYLNLGEGFRKRDQICSIEFCNLLAKGGKGLCNKHHLQHYRNTSKGKQVLLTSAKKHRKTLKGKYSACKGDAVRRNLEWKLSFEEFKGLREESKDICFYCGNKILHNGGALDRLDNCKGYFVENCVVACIGCNRLKGAELSAEETIKIVSLLKELRNDENPWKKQKV